MYSLLISLLTHNAPHLRSMHHRATNDAMNPLDRSINLKPNMSIPAIRTRIVTMCLQTYLIGAPGKVRKGEFFRADGTFPEREKWFKRSTGEQYLSLEMDISVESSANCHVVAVAFVVVDYDVGVDRPFLCDVASKVWDNVLLLLVFLTMVWSKDAKEIGSRCHRYRYKDAV